MLTITKKFQPTTVSRRRDRRTVAVDTIVGVEDRVRTSITRVRPVAATVSAMAVERRPKRVWRQPLLKGKPPLPRKRLLPAVAPRCRRQKAAAAVQRKRLPLRITLTTSITSIICDIKATMRSSLIYIPLRRLSMTSSLRCVDHPLQEDALVATPTPPYSLRTTILSVSDRTIFHCQSAHFYQRMFVCLSVRP